MEKTLVDRTLSPYSDSIIDISKLDIIIPDRTSPELTITKIIPRQTFCYFDSDDEKTNDVRLLSEYVTNFIKNDNTYKKKYTIEITNKIVSMLRLLLNSSFFFDTEFFFISIVKGDKIDADKVPFIMDLLIELYKNLKKKIQDVDIYHCGEILKLLFSITVYENIIRIRTNQEQVISCFNNIIETSVYISKIDKPRKGIFKCIRNIFG
jgi:hypothetical protein